MLMTQADIEQLKREIIEEVMASLFPPPSHQELFERASQGDLTAVDEWNKMQRNKG